MARSYDLGLKRCHRLVTHARMMLIGTGWGYTRLGSCKAISLDGEMRRAMLQFMTVLLWGDEMRIS